MKNSNMRNIGLIIVICRFLESGPVGPEQNVRPSPPVLLAETATVAVSEVEPYYSINEVILQFSAREHESKAEKSWYSMVLSTEKRSSSWVLPTTVM
ncbi:hypothetical protein BN1723_006071 [Verticillium longisporum]|uniref:Uncharacterized protein n=1 Tax=Verticillium longisporum TaxID=100787 RepID=A0A0G4ND13_VERLO|nr:hypothetical protein BN1708_014736 [Verticillium longisporum]CRK44362.1 hypothetical protein BN1723_006071 [Verticillium longisporum]